MGRAKDLMLEQEERGFGTVPEKNVCPNHFDDYAIIAYVKGNGKKSKCDYCGRISKAIGLELLIRFICEAVYYYYDDAANWLGYESAEGGYIGSHFETYDLLVDELELDLGSEDLFNDILSSLPSQFWCKVDPYGLEEHEELIYEWEQFAKLIKHKIRFTFYRTTVFDSSLYHKSSKTLDDISETIHKLDLLTKLEVGHKLYRTRQHSVNDNPVTFQTLTSPPIDACLFPNRMSPSGVSMFYGAMNARTAELEVIERDVIKDKPILTRAKFSVKEELTIVDLCNLPPVPSIYDAGKRLLRSRILFLRAFVRELAKPIARNGKEHLEYVPTQVVTEYFRYVVPEFAGYPIHGILYPSAKEGNGKCCVLFMDNEESKGYLKLVAKSITKRDLRRG